MSVLNKKNTAEVFKEGDRKAFFMKGGASIIASASVKEADAQKSLIANKVLAVGGKSWSGELKSAQADKSLYANKAMAQAKYLGGNKMSEVSAELAARVVEAAEKEAALQNVVLKQKAGVESLNKIKRAGVKSCSFFVGAFGGGINYMHWYLFQNTLPDRSHSLSYS